MPGDMIAKCDVISVACLSLLDYANHPRMENVRALRMSVKRALGQKFAAPEILYNCLQSTSLDPCIRWLLTSLRLWFYVLRTGEDSAVLGTIVNKCKGRLGWAAASLAKQRILIATEGIWVGDTFVSVQQSWSECRSKSLEHISRACNIPP